MRRVNEWFVNRRDYLTLIAALIFSFSLIFSNDGLQLQTISAWTVDGYGYLLQRLSAVQRLNGVYEENQWLRQENAELMLENSSLKEALLENQRLRQLLDFKSTSQLQLVPAKVIGKNNNGFINTIVLATGEVDSIQKNMAVVTAQGVVGKIFSISKYHCVSQVLLDRNFRASAMIQRSRVMGIIKWHEGNQVIMAEVPKRSDVRVGDVVVTSVYSIIFPAGLPIGYVSKCVENDHNMFMTIIVEPAVDFSKLEEVFVIKSRQLEIF